MSALLRWSRRLACSAHALLLLAAHAQLSPADALKSFQLADPALRIELVAAEPLVESPCAIAFDEKGRLFVAENRGYPNTIAPPQGRIALLTDTDGDGVMDQRTTFADGLTFPNGVLPWRGGVIVTCAPDVLFLRDTDGDGRADERRVLLTGFDPKGSTQLRVNAPTLGPDGWIWLAAGLSGGSITCPEHPGRTPLKMTSDARFHPDTLEVENVDGRSQYGMSFDDAGQRFICMNRVPVQHVVLSSKWLARNPHLAFSETVQDCSERTVRTGLRGGGDGVRLFPISRNITTADSHAGSFSAACGIHIWRGGALPWHPTKGYRNCVFTCDPTANLVHVDHLGRRGLTFAAESLFEDREFLASRDDWCRPVFLATGPDGALYVCDMYRKTIEHPDYLPEESRKHTDLESGKDMGRIWRVIQRDAAAAPPLPTEWTPHNIGRALSGGNAWLRETARRLALENPTAEMREALAPANRWEEGHADRLRLRHLLGALSSSEMRTALDSKSPSNTDTVIALLGQDLAAGKGDAKMLLDLGTAPMRWDFDRTRYAIALGYVPGEAATQRLAEAAASWRDQRWVQAAVVSSASGRELDLLKAILTRPDMRSMLLTWEPLVAMLAETLGRADAARSADTLDDILGSLDGYDLDSRAVIAAAYARGHGLRLTPSTDRLRTLLEDLGRALRTNGRLSSAQTALLARTPWEIGGVRLLAFAMQGDRGALRALAEFDSPEIPRHLVTSEYLHRGSPEERERWLSACLARPVYCGPVLDAIEAGRFPANALDPQRRQLFLKHKDPAIRERAEKIFATATPQDRQLAYEGAKAALALVPHAQHGRAVFKTLCATCHRLEREGHAVGPDLFDMRSQPKENILFHIVVPDAEIAPAFAAYACETKDGRAFAGILASETPVSVTIRQPGGTEETVLRSGVKSLTALPGSLMPPGLDAAMSPQDLADLLAFLKGEQ